jgi:predicted transcriptional regulator of viral defense system
VDRLISGLAERQHAVVAHRQIVDLGLSPRAIQDRVRTGRLHVIHRGVYAVGHPILSRPGTFMAAVLACGAGDVLSHRSAAAHWGILQEGPRWVEVTVPGNGGRKQRFVLPHRSKLTAAETLRRHNIPITSPSRTLVDCADVMTERHLERALDEAHFLRLDLSGLEPWPGRAGAGRLRRVLTTHVPGSTRTRSELEESMLTVCRRASLPHRR